MGPQPADETPVDRHVLNFDQKLIPAFFEMKRHDVVINSTRAPYPPIDYERAVVPDFQSVIAANAEPSVDVGGYLNLGPRITDAEIRISEAGRRSSITQLNVSKTI